MTLDQITQLRTLLKEIKVAAGKCQKNVFFYLKAEKALALLPCETCNGAGKVPYVPIGGMFPDPHTPGPCPDCQ